MFLSKKFEDVIQRLNSIMAAVNQREEDWKLIRRLYDKIDTLEKEIIDIRKREDRYYEMFLELKSKYDNKPV